MIQKMLNCSMKLYFAVLTGVKPLVKAVPPPLCNSGLITSDCLQIKLRRKFLNSETNPLS